MKYGFNDYEWKEDCYDWDKVCAAIANFNVEGFIPFMKRKTYDEKDEKMLKALTEMVKMMNAHKAKMQKK